MSEQPDHSNSTRASGVLMLGLCALALLFMAHHPTLGAPGYDTLAEEAAAESGLNGLVHGMLIVITVGFFVCLAMFADLLNRNYFITRAGLLVLGIATLTMIGAALVSGFIVPETARKLLAAGMANEFEPILRMLGATNQTLAETSVIAYGAGMLLWGARLVRMNGFARVSALVALIAGIILAGGMLSGLLHLDVQGMTLALAIMCAWFATAGIVMVMRRDGA